jgi:Arc/MetJ-type ribon-helix-helix transcriptional regulator
MGFAGQMPPPAPEVEHRVVQQSNDWYYRGTGAAAMNIRLTPEQERIVNDELKSGHFRTAEEVIGEALQILRRKERSVGGVEPNIAQREAVREMLAFVEKNHVRLEGVSVKELIHEGHRL